MDLNTSDSPIGLACDHAGFELKKYVITLLEEKGIPYTDFGTYSSESCDYPDFAHALGYAIERGECQNGVAICGSGNGISMALNKHQAVRAALCWEEEIAILARQHNNANVCVIPGRFISNTTAKQIVEAFLKTPFEGGRHTRRVEKIAIR